MRFFTSLPIAFCCVLFLACNSPQNQSAQSKAAADTIVNTAISTLEKQVPADSLIIPGKSIGQISLNENAANVYKLLGKPDSSDAAMGKSLSTWYADHDKKGYVTQIFCARDMGNADENISSINQIRVTSPYFKTKEGICAGTTLQEINAVFSTKKSVSYPNKNSPYAIYDNGKGIAFEINNSQKCMAVIVYLPGDKGGITYLSFHS